MDNVIKLKESDLINMVKTLLNESEVKLVDKFLHLNVEGLIDTPAFAEGDQFDVIDIGSHYVLMVHHFTTGLVLIDKNMVEVEESYGILPANSAIYKIVERLLYQGAVFNIGDWLDKSLKKEKSVIKPYVKFLKDRFNESDVYGFNLNEKQYLFFRNNENFIGLVLLEDNNNSLIVIESFEDYFNLDSEEIGDDRIIQRACQLIFDEEKIKTVVINKSLPTKSMKSLTLIGKGSDVFKA